jgi:hypothetical protein
MAQYTHVTWNGLVTQLAGRLGDVGNVYWATNELYLYIVESIRTWSFLTAFWRDTGEFNTSVGTPFYDITSLTNGTGAALLDYTVTDSDLTAVIQYQLLEPSTGNSWTGSEQFALSDITNALEKRRNAFLAETACRVTRTTAIPAALPVYKLGLADSTVAVRRVAFQNAANSISPLWPESISNQMAFAPDNLLTVGSPVSYSIDSAQPNDITLAPPIGDVGTFETLTISTGAPLDPTSGVVLGIPDDMTVALKWGALADVLGKDSEVRDAERAGFCERRYRLFVEMAKYAPVITSARINGAHTFTDSIANLDSFMNSWQSTSGTPIYIGVEPNLIGLGPVPDVIGSIQLDVVRKAPIGSGTDYVQIGREYIDPILDYAVHLACFKMGGIEFRSSFRQAQNFFDAALDYNRRLAAISPAAIKVMRNSTKELADRAYTGFGGLGALVQPQDISTVATQRSNES